MNNNIFSQNDLWKIELIEPGLIPNPILQRAKGKYGFFDKNASIYMPLAVYNGLDKINELLEWKDYCVKLFENRLNYNRYITLYNNMKEVTT